MVRVQIGVKIRPPSMLSGEGKGSRARLVSSGEGVSKVVEGGAKKRKREIESER